jgi:RimJ/RimL family protein N-acetyltransferase
VTAAPKIRTERLLLRPFTAADAPKVQRLCSERDVAATTASIPHPYPPGAAAEWIATHRELHAKGEATVLAVTTAEEGVVGAIGLRIELAHAHAELGYWIGKPYWSRGFATEAARAVVRHGFGELALQRVFARHLSRNVASGRVLTKIGMKHEGRVRSHVFRFGRFEDLDLYGMLKEEFEQLAAAGERARAKST